jgi:hypothetical protein
LLIQMKLAVTILHRCYDIPVFIDVVSLITWHDLMSRTWVG